MQFTVCGTKFVVMVHAECSFGKLVTTRQITFHYNYKK